MPNEQIDSVGPISRAKARVQRARVSGRKARKALMTPAGAKGVLVEAAWLSTHIAMYPMGLLEERAREEDLRHNLEGLPPIQRGLIIGDVEAAGTPIIMVHGVIDNHSVFTVLRRSLSRRGFGRVITLNYSPLSGDIRRLSRRLALLVESVCRETGYERVHIIGHSMGGLVARYYVQCQGGDARVHTLVTLGSPHAGTAYARAIPLSLARQLRPDSEFVKELAEPSPGCRTRMIAVWSDLDQVIVPQRNARIVHPDLNARNVFIRGVGHMSLPVDGRIVHEISTALSHLDRAGTTVAVGATSISSSTGRQAGTTANQPTATNGYGSPATSRSAR
ncbi:MAG: pimeloyl-ACP methyl ester carboxylesterase [Actinomycetes bacterium]|jgi:pimeloyl-ACP methyl ester carboxylesterase